VVAWDLDPALRAAGTETAEPIRRVAIGADGRHAAAFTEAGASMWDLESGQAISGSARAARALDAIRTQLDIDDAIVGKLEARRIEADVRAGDDPDGDRPRPSEEGLGAFVHRDFYGHRWAVGAGGRLALHWLRPRAKTSEAEEDPGIGSRYAVDIVDVDRGELVARLSGHSTHILDGAISADGRRAATGSIGRLVRVWDLPSGELRATLPAHDDPVSAVDLSADGTLVVSASWDGSVRVWDIENGRILATFSGDNPMVDCVMSGDGSRVVAGDRAGRVHILRLHRTAGG
jgi:WD40 repeat protein